MASDLGPDIVNSGLTFCVDAASNRSYLGRNFVRAKIYSVYNGGARSANYSVQYSDDNSTWTTAFSGVATNNSACGIQINSGAGDGSYGHHRYWRYVEGSAVVSHHPRVSRIILTDVSGIDSNLIVYTSDNCSDSGTYIVGTTTATDFGATAWYNLSGNSTGSLVNGPSFISQNSGFLRFDGVDDYVSNISNTGITHGTSNFSYFVWVRLQGKPSLGTIFENGSWTSCLLIRYETDGITIYSMSSYWGKFSFNPTLNTWNHLAFIRNGNVIEFYINGVYQTNIAFTANISPSSNIFIGTSQHATGQVFNGDIAVAQIYTQALTATQVIQNFNAQRDRFGI